MREPRRGKRRRAKHSASASSKRGQTEPLSDLLSGYAVTAFALFVAVALASACLLPLFASALVPAGAAAAALSIALLRRSPAAAMHAAAVALAIAMFAALEGSRDEFERRALDAAERFHQRHGVYPSSVDAMSADEQGALVRWLHPFEGYALRCSGQRDGFVCVRRVMGRYRRISRLPGRTERYID